MADLPMAPSPQYPRPVTQVHQIEVTTQCNLRCVYCPSPKLEAHRGQPKQHMTLDTFERALEWCDYFQRKGTQGELSLTGIGETLLHPDWKDMVRLARETLPSNFLNFSTNGLLLDDDACAHLAEYGFGVYVSLHRPEKAGRALERAKKHGILMTYNASAAISSFDWAGQVDWYVSADRSPCEWLREGWCNVLVDGRVTRCCLDATGKGTFAHVDDDPGRAVTSPWDLCSTCHQVP
jgi:hypothetical protein